MYKVFNILLENSKPQFQKELNGIILAAGKSKRFRDSMESENSKALITLSNGKSILANKIMQMKTYLKKVVVVLGYDAEKIKNVIYSELAADDLNSITFVHNGHYETHENWLSLKIGLNALNDVDSAVIINEVDSIYPQQVFKNILKTKGNVFACKKSESPIMKIIYSDDKIQMATKSNVDTNVYGDYIGLARLDGKPKWTENSYYEIDLVKSLPFQIMDIFTDDFVNMNDKEQFLKAKKLFNIM
jgi:choline kinase